MKKIKQLRMERQWSQERVVRMMGYKSRSTVNKFEPGINEITQPKIIAFANLFEVEPWMLLNDEPERSTQLQTIGERIKELRKKHGLTYDELANMCGVGKSTVRKWEVGMITGIQQTNLAKLACALGTTPEFLMGWDEDEQREKETINGLMIFENPEFGQVRTVMDDEGSPLFCGSDVARALGYSNPRDALRQHCRGVVKRDGVSQTTNQHGVTTNQVTEMSFIPESDVYRLIIRSKLPGAQKFESWLMEEVLPSIRRTGSYHPTPHTITIDREALAAIIGMSVSETLKQARAMGEELKETKGRRVRRQIPLKPFSEVVNTTMENQRVTVEDVAKRLNVSASLVQRWRNGTALPNYENWVWFVLEYRIPWVALTEGIF